MQQHDAERNWIFRRWANYYINKESTDRYILCSTLIYIQWVKVEKTYFKLSKSFKNRYKYLL